MFVLQSSTGSYVIAYHNAPGFDYTTALDEATQWPTSTQAIKALTARAAYYGRTSPASKVAEDEVAEDEFSLVEVAESAPARSILYIVRIL
jgi:hypothetical protein